MQDTVCVLGLLYVPSDFLMRAPQLQFWFPRPQFCHVIYLHSNQNVDIFKSQWMLNSHQVPDDTNRSD